MSLSISSAADEAAGRLHGALQEKFGRAYAGFAAYALDPKQSGHAYVMGHCNSDRASQAHNRFTKNVLEGRKVVLESTTLPPAIASPAEPILLQSRQVGGHICVNLRPSAQSPLILQAALNAHFASDGETIQAGTILKLPDVIPCLEDAARAWPETTMASRAKIPATPTHYLVHYDITDSERIRAENGHTAREIFVRLADEAAFLAPRYGGEFFRFEGDGGWMAFPLRLQGAFNAPKEAKQEKIAPFAAELAKAFSAVKEQYLAIAAVRACSLRIYAEPGYLHPVKAGGRDDYDGDAFSKIRKMHETRTFRTPSIVINDMPSPFA